MRTPPITAKYLLGLVMALAVCSAEAAGTTRVTVNSVQRLVEELTAWQTSANHYEITLADGTYDLSEIAENPMHASGLLAFTPASSSRKITLRGASAASREKVVLDGKGLGRVIYVQMYNNTGTWTLENLTVQNGKASGAGGGLNWNGTGASGVINNCVFRNCTCAGASGGAIYVNKSSVEMTDSLIISNSVTAGDGQSAGGGAVYGIPTVMRCTFIGNRGESKICGGALFCPKGVLANVTDCNFTDNALTNGSAFYGGALYCLGGGTISNCAFTNNTTASSNGGGAICIWFGSTATQSPTTISGCTFVSNSAASDGGAVRYAAGKNNGSSILNCTFVSNSTSRAGGGVAGGFSLVSNCTFVSNSAYQGGGIADCPNVIDCDMAFNSSWGGVDDGGGAANNCTLRHCWVTNNVSTTFHCGGVSSCKVYDSFVARNRGEIAGALRGSYNSYFENCEFTGEGVESSYKDQIFLGCSFNTCTFHDFKGGAYLINGLAGVTNSLFYSNDLGSVGRIHSGAADGSMHVNCTFVGNVYDQYFAVSDGASATVKNCLFYKNGYLDSDGSSLVYEDIARGTPTTASIDHSFFKTKYSGISAETNFKNTGKDPRLMGDRDPKRPYAPRRRSILNGAGDVQDWMASATDLDGHPRLTDGKVAIGAYETTEPPQGMMLRLH